MPPVTAFLLSVANMRASLVNGLLEEVLEDVPADEAVPGLSVGVG